MKKYELMALPYAPDALEPVISKETTSLTPEPLSYRRGEFGRARGAGGDCAKGSGWGGI